MQPWKESVAVHTTVCERRWSSCLSFDVSVGCYCADESHCHRSVLKRLIEGAK